MNDVAFYSVVAFVVGFAVARLFISRMSRHAYGAGYWQGRQDELLVDAIQRFVKKLPADEVRQMISQQVEQAGVPLTGAFDDWDGIDRIAVMLSPDTYGDGPRVSE